ncbi:hypothetical protein GDO86_020019, partial [Hymenochirus boettgeri]
GFSPVTITQPANATLSCSSQNWYPKPNVSWVSSTNENLTNINTVIKQALLNMFLVRSDLSNASPYVQYSCLVENDLATANGTAMITDFGLQTDYQLTINSCDVPVSVPYFWLCPLLLSLLLGSANR